MSYDIDHSPLPSRHAIRTAVEGLVGRGVQLTDSHALQKWTTNVIAVYVTDQTQTAAVAVTNLQCAARLGGALGMLPKGGVEDMIEEKDLTGVIRDNCFEVLNVLAAVFNVHGAPHVRLYEMYGPHQDPPAEITQLAYAAGGRVDAILSVAGYGEGAFSIVVR